MYSPQVALNLLQPGGEYKRLYNPNEITANLDMSINDFMTKISMDHSCDIDSLALFDCLKQSDQPLVKQLPSSPFPSDFLKMTLYDLISPLKRAKAISDCALLILNVRPMSDERDRLRRDLFSQKAAAQEALNNIIAELKDAHKPAVSGNRKGGKRKTRRYK